MASSRAALWAAAVDGGFSKGEAFVSQMPDGKNPENPGFSWALVKGQTGRAKPRRKILRKKSDVGLRGREIQDPRRAPFFAALE